MSVTGTASISGYSQAGTSASVVVHPAVSISAMPSVAGNAGTAANSSPTVRDLLGAGSYTLLLNGSPVGNAGSNLGGLSTGLTFSASSGAVTGTPTASCNASGLQVRVVDSYDGSTGTSPAFSIAVVYQSTTIANSSDTYYVPPYNTLRIRMWSGAGGSAGMTNGGSTAYAGSNGGASSIPALGLYAPGGTGAPGFAGGGYSGTPSGGNVYNIPGNPGASGQARSASANGSWYWTAGGSAPGGGGAGAPGGSVSGGLSRNGVTGSAPGGGASGASQLSFYGIGGGWIGGATGGSGSGSYLEAVYTAGQAGAPAPGTYLGYTVGSGGPGGVAPGTGAAQGAYGANGQIQFIVN
jgi:hypothetical protein